MTNKELNKVLEAIKYVPNENERDEITQIILKAANDSITTFVLEDDAPELGNKAGLLGAAALLMD